MTRASSHSERLASGRPVVVEESHGLPLVAFAVAFETGSYFDPVGKEGLFRFVGRMLRRGTKTLDAKALEAAIDRLGAELTVEVSHANMTLHGQVIRRNLEPFVKLVGDVLAEPAFAPDELERLRKKALAELVEARDNDRSLAQNAFRSAMFGDHSYGRRSHARTLAAITADDVRETYRANALRENVSFGFAGDIDVAKAREIASGWLERLPSGRELPSFSELRDPAGPQGRSLVIVDKPERTQTQILVGALGTSGHDDDHVPLMVGTAIFGGTFTSRLMREVRSKRGWSYGASARLNVERARHAFTMWTFPAATDAGKCLALELGLLEKLVSGGVSAKEVAFVKRYLVRSHAFEIDTPQKRMHQALDTHLLGLPADYHTGYVAKVLATSHEAVNAALARRIHPKDLGIVVVGTAKDIRADLEKAIPDLARVSVVPFDAD